MTSPARTTREELLKEVPVDDRRLPPAEIRGWPLPAGVYGWRWDILRGGWNPITDDEFVVSRADMVRLYQAAAPHLLPSERGSELLSVVPLVIKRLAGQAGASNGKV